MRENTIQNAEKIFFFNGGILKTTSAIKLGIHPETLYKMQKLGIITKLEKGLFRLSHLPPLSNPDLVIIALKIPHSVLCLTSALAFHKLTSIVPEQTHIALKKGSEPPRISKKVRIFWFSPFTFIEGVENQIIDGINLKVYSPEKTIVDCFKYRNKIGGPNIAIEALRIYRETKPPNLEELIRLARISRMEKVMKPYLEALF